MDDRALLRTLKAQFALDWEGIHGIRHWERVRGNGLRQGFTDGDVTVTTCWDADRLDLGRVGAKPKPSRLCTAAARDPATIEWAFLRSLR